MSSHPLPPALSLILGEKIDLSNLSEARKKLSRKGFVKDLKDQAHGTSREDTCYAASTEQALEALTAITPTPALNPLTAIDKCASFECRANHASAFARMAGLLSDAVALPDPFTHLAIAMNEPAELARRLLEELKVYSVLEPLFASGLLRFTPPMTPLCKNCTRMVANTLPRVADDVTELVLTHGEFRIEHSEPGDCLVTFKSPLIGDGLFHEIELMGPRSSILNGFRLQPGAVLSKSAAKRLRTDVRGVVEFDIAAAVESYQMSNERGTPLATTSRLDSMLLPSMAGGAPKNYESWEGLREVKLPWLGKLSPTEVMQLREEAHNALPRLRTLLGRALATPDDPSSSHAKCELVDELRASANDVEAELESLQKRSKLVRLGFGLTTAALVVYGVYAGGDSGATAFGGLLAALAAAHPVDAAEKRERDKLKSQPGYVLLKARELIDSRHVHRE